METNSSTIESLITHAEDYLKTRQELTQHVVTEKVIVLSSSLITAYILFTIFMMAAFFASWAIAGWISKTLNNDFAGYWIIAGVYAILACIMVIMQKRWLKIPLMNTMVKNIYNDGNE